MQLVRELYGVQTAMHAAHGMFVCLGTFTVDATQFAARVGMTLVGGDELLRIISTGLAGCYRPRYLNIQRLNYLWTIRHSSARIASNLIT